MNVNIEVRIVCDMSRLIMMIYICTSSWPLSGWGAQSRVVSVGILYL